MTRPSVWAVIASIALVALPAHSVVIVNSNVTMDTVWGLDGANPDTVYEIAGQLSVLGCTLTIRPGVTVQFGLSAGLSIGSSSTAGSLQAVGTAMQPIRFTGTIQTPGHWRRLLFDDGSDLNGASSRMEHCIVSHGGRSTGGFPALVACVNTTSPTMVNCVLEHSSSDGLTLNGGSRISVSQTTVREIARYAANIPATAVANVAGNTLVPKSGAPNVIYLRAATVAESATWPVPSPGFTYEVAVNEDIAVEGPSGPVLTLLPGTVIKHRGGTYWLIGCGAPGALRATDVVFTGADPIPGRWTGIAFCDQAFDGPPVTGANPTQQNSSLDRVEIAYAGFSVEGALWLVDAAPRLSEVWIHHSATAGMLAENAGSTPHVRFSRFENNREGIRARSNARPYIAACCFVSNANYGILAEPFDDGGGAIEARWSWWNSATGPSGMPCDMLVGSGDAVSDGVRFCPFATTAVCDSPTDALSDRSSSPAFSLSEASPSPARGSVVLFAELATRGPIATQVFDARGRRVRSLDLWSAGPSRVPILWNGHDQSGRAVPSGRYFVRVTFGGAVVTRAATIIR